MGGFDSVECRSILKRKKLTTNTIIYSLNRFSFLSPPPYPLPLSLPLSTKQTPSKKKKTKN